MKIRSLDLDDEEMPETVHVSMTIREAALIASLTGTATGERLDRDAPGLRAENGAVWEALCGVVFNRFWDDGLHEAVADMRSAADGP